MNIAATRQVAQYVLLLRMTASGLPLVALLHHRGVAGTVLLAVAVAFGLNAAGLHWWSAVEHMLAGPLRGLHLVLDIALGMVVLTVLGAGSPFVLYNVGTAALAGLLYPAAVAAGATAVLCGGHVALETQRAGVSPGAADFHNLVTLPALYLLAGCGAVLLRRLLDSQARAAVRLRDLAHRSAVADERLRMARDLHDSLTKDLYGLSLVSQALGRSAENGDLPAVGRDSHLISDVLEQVCRQARSTIAGLRQEPDPRPFGPVVQESSREALYGTGLRVDVVVEDGRDPGPAARTELLAILREALENVRRHARAGRAWVRLAADAEGGIVLTIRDDGVGFTGQQATARAAAGHYGLVGMRERAERLAGTVRVDSGTGGGTCITVRLPATACERAAA